MWSADSGGVAQKEISNVFVDLIKKKQSYRSLLYDMKVKEWACQGWVVH